MLLCPWHGFVVWFVAVIVVYCYADSEEKVEICDLRWGWIVICGPAFPWRKPIDTLVQDRTEHSSRVSCTLHFASSIVSKDGTVS